MARKKFNDLTPPEKYLRLRKGKNALMFGKWFSILAPYITIGIINFDEYFYESNGVKMSLGCVLACIVFGITVVNESKGQKKINNLVGWAIAFALVFLLDAVLDDLLLIVGAGLLGQLIGAGFELGATNLSTKSDIYKKANIEAEAMTYTKEEEKGEILNE